MSDHEGGLVTSYCVGLASTFRRLSNDLALPRIDQELYTDLFIQPLEAQQGAEQAISPASSVGNLNTSASDMQAEALISLGATELLVAALRTHEKQTLLVLQAIALRESVVSRMWSCCDAYDDSTAGASEEARFTFLRLLQEHQLVTLLTVESIFEWREALSRPYPFLLRNGVNYLLSIREDCVALDSHALVRSLSGIRLRQDPLCAKADLPRMLHRLETMRRSRLITTGALWNVGLQPLRPLQARGRSQSAEVRRLPGLGRNGSRLGSRNGGGTPSKRPPPTQPKARATSAAALGPLPKLSVQESNQLSHFHDGKAVDFVGEVTRLNNALKRSQKGSGASSPPSRTASVSSHRTGSVARRLPDPHPPPVESAGGRQRQHRLLTAARIVEKEAELQLTVTEELYTLATELERFVPVLDVPQLFASSTVAAPAKEKRDASPADSWPLDRTQWAACAAAEGRVDRLGCMSTARETLQGCGLLSEWQRRMGRRTSCLSDLNVSHSKPSVVTASSSSFAEGPLTPLRTTATARASRYSDSFEHSSAASASGRAVDTRLPMLAAAEDSLSSTSSSSSSSSASASSANSEVPLPRAAVGDGVAEKTAASVHSEAFSSDFESESDSGASHASTPAKAAAGTTESSPREDSSGKKGRRHGAAASSPASSVAPSSLTSSANSSLPERSSHRPSLDELREQLLAEHRLNSSSQSYSQ